MKNRFVHFPEKSGTRSANELQVNLEKMKENEEEKRNKYGLRSNLSPKLQKIFAKTLR